MKSQRRKQTIALSGAALLALALMPTMAAAQFYSDVQSNGPLQLSGYGSFFIQGTPVLLTEAETGRVPPVPGNRIINQMYVQFMKPQGQGNGKKHVPIVFVHGGGLSSKSWQTTPDGRMGWDEYFVRKGFDTYLGEQVARGRSGFDARVYNKVMAGLLPGTAQPGIRLSTEAANWNAFRWGTTDCTVAPCWATTTPHPGIRFPMSTVGVGNGGSNLQFLNSGVPGLNPTLSGASPPGTNNGPADPGAFYNSPAQMAELAKQLGGAILVGHSESSSFPLRAALQPASGCYPWTSASACKVKGIIQLETGCFGNLTTAQITTLSHIPILIEFGDFSPVPQPAAICQMSRGNSPKPVGARL
jgi:pimeloyl-ACP methyl ester carboxylesterase